MQPLERPISEHRRNKRWMNIDSDVSKRKDQNHVILIQPTYKPSTYIQHTIYWSHLFNKCYLIRWILLLALILKQYCLILKIVLWWQPGKTYIIPGLSIGYRIIHSLHIHSDMVKNSIGTKLVKCDNEEISGKKIPLLTTISSI